MADHALLFSGTLLVAVFLTSSVGKIFHFSSFTDSVREMRLLPIGAVPSVAILIVTAELVAALSIPIGLLTSSALLVYAFALSAVLCVAFSLAIITVIRRGSSVACNCFGRQASEFSARHIVRNTLLAAAAVVGMLSADVGVSSWTTETGITIVAGLVLSLLVILMDDLVDLFA
ncbi:methylamine utilization protein MauE [Acrocarpospora macrocephala]|uniref:Methylamine utilization protein MauE n=1 Tax=Acrocarpospora macrocephala TaxID=150177 RepID=A0A5M3WHD2_9ACTN|nr:MauE/DoxX family redox-associated membrane protein [Acrocarpospora macrocephala]GES06513.1 methylamine utilization protein MauE [Acrocarpospora macrocephala]